MAENGAFGLVLNAHGLKLTFPYDLGRNVPRNVRSLKADAFGLGSDSNDPQDKKFDERTTRIVAFRYAEYCVTAPLLFLAVVCLLTVDSPAWLYLSGYFMIVACNLLGIALHYSITTPKDGTSLEFIPWINYLLETGSW
jgi:hypothetical protein